MKFIVRKGFVVHDSKLISIQQGDQEVSQVQTNTYYEGQTVDLETDTALEHLHKLEAADKEAAKFMDSRTAQVVIVSADGIAYIPDPAVAALTGQVSALTDLIMKLTESVQTAVAPPAAEAAPTV